MDKLQEILEDLEKEAQAKRSIITNTYNNQPELISISSDNAVITTQNQTNDAYYSFTCNLIRPAIGVKSIQLLKANIPQATALSFTNGELLFPYYRIKTQENIANYTYFTEEPNIDNLYYVRLLPSYYPPNIIPNSQLYGFNKTFNNYTELSTELAKACANDLLYTNLNTPHFIPNDCLISYNSDYNKFQFTGNNTTTPWTPPTYTLNPASIVQENKLITYQSQEYLSLQNNNSVNPALIIYTYTSGQVFYKFNIALYLGTYYTCVVSEVSNVLPTNPTYWVVSTYNPAVNYGGTLIGFNVLYNGFWYVSITNAANTGQTPGSSPLFWRLQPFTTPGVMNWWQVYTGTTGFTYLIAGFQDPNVLLLQEDINEGVNGDNPDFFYGLYGLNNIVSIPTPPVSPGKTLAKRLGFSWNGLYTWPGTNEVAPIQYPQGSSLPIFWNRFRPIPPYELIPPEELGDIPIPNNNPFTSTTYIAENYCNLVYTSILSIISNITTASTLDSTNRRNILWLLPMNCGQLGISFSDAYIDTGLTKINNDIYQINIELRNELDEPFYISNNGISTFLLKLTY
jgi:hypothetical protein